MIGVNSAAAQHLYLLWICEKKTMQNYKIVHHLGNVLDQS